MVGWDKDGEVIVVEAFGAVCVHRKVEVCMTKNNFQGEVGLGLARTAGLALPRAALLFEPTYVVCTILRVQTSLLLSDDEDD